MERIIYLNGLYDIYKELLTEKQRLYFEEYYFNNLSLGEIAENNNISRNAVHGQLKMTEEKLEEYEVKLRLHEKKNKIIRMLKNKIDDEIIEKIDQLL